MEFTVQKIRYKQAQNPLFAMMYEFRHTVVVEDFVNSGKALDVTTQYTHTGRGIRMHSSTAPRGFDTIDTWIDFCEAIDRGHYVSAIGAYYRLKRFLNM